MPFEPPKSAFLMVSVFEPAWKFAAVSLVNVDTMPKFVLAVDLRLLTDLDAVEEDGAGVVGHQLDRDRRAGESGRQVERDRVLGGLAGA